MYLSVQGSSGTVVYLAAYFLKSKFEFASSSGRHVGWRLLLPTAVSTVFRWKAITVLITSPEDDEASRRNVIFHSLVLTRIKKWLIVRRIFDDSLLLVYKILVLIIFNYIF